MLLSSNQKFQSQNQPHKCPSGGQIEPNTSTPKPLRTLKVIGIQSRVFISNAESEQIWNRAITNGNVKSQIIPPARNKPMTLRRLFCIIH